MYPTLLFNLLGLTPDSNLLLNKYDLLLISTLIHYQRCQSGAVGHQ